MALGTGTTSLRRTIALGMTITALGVVPLLFIGFARLAQIRAERHRWGELAEGARSLVYSGVCTGASSALVGRADVAQWRRATKTWLGVGRDSLGLPPALAAELVSFDEELGRAGLGGADVLPWVEAHCVVAARLGNGLLAWGNAFLLAPASQQRRPEDLAVRDFTAFVLVWAIVAPLLVWWVRRRVRVPVLGLARIARRIADGDVRAVIPNAEGDLEALSEALRDIVGRYRFRDELFGAKIVELRDLVRRLLEMLDQPVLVVSAHKTLDFLNDAAAQLMGQSVADIEGAALEAVSGGEALRQAVESVLTQGGLHGDAMIQTGAEATKLRSLMARCAVVRDLRGKPTRVVMVLDQKTGGWWGRLWRGGVDGGHAEGVASPGAEEKT